MNELVALQRELLGHHLHMHLTVSTVRASGSVVAPGSDISLAGPALTLKMASRFKRPDFRVTVRQNPILDQVGMVYRKGFPPVTAIVAPET
jgi:hypothetical protein